MEEVWKDIRGFEGLYQISNLGVVKSLDRIDNNNHPRKEKIKIPIIDNREGKGYYRVTLCKNGKTKRFQVHCLVAQTFLDNPYNLPEVNHKDENPSNNCVENLEYCDHKYNVNYGTRNERISEKHKGIKHTYETKKKLSEQRRGVLNTKCSKPILQIDKNTNEVIAEFPSTAEVHRQLGFSNSSISQCCLGKQKTSYGYKWQIKMGRN